MIWVLWVNHLILNDEEYELNKRIVEHYFIQTMNSAHTALFLCGVSLRRQRRIQKVFKDWKGVLQYYVWFSRS
jgi:hypothetical protein